MSASLVVIGLDGATWKLLDPLIDAGRLPTLQRLREEGTSGTLESVRPPISCPAWFCYSTGKNPGKLGIYGWRNFDPATHTDRFNDYKQLEDAEIWDWAGRAGLKSAVINIPTMFPPKAIEGYMVSGMQAEEHQAYTQPPELKHVLQDAFDYRVSPKDKMLWAPEAAYQQIVDLFPKRFDAARHLLDKVDLLHVTIFHIDELQHRAWGTEKLFEAWERIDTLLADFLSDLPEETDVLLMSDHGFGPRREKFYINTWLENNGYLATESNRLGETLRSLGITRKRLERVLKNTNLLGAAKRLVPDTLQHKVKEQDGSTSNQRRLPQIDWENTAAFASTNFTIHVLDEDQIDPICQALREVTTPNGDPLFEEVLRADTVLHGDKLEEAPQILLLPAWGNATGDALGKPLWEQLPNGRAGHRMDGIFVAHGPSFAPEATIDGARLVDLAPTILHALGLPVPEDMDGDVLDIFQNDAQIHYTRDAVAVGHFSDDELEHVEERLRGLGYLE